MATKKKYYYYVLVMTDNGPKFVTSINYQNKVAHWDATEKPLELGQLRADDLTFGLICNFNVCYTVKSPIQIEEQPYRYSVGHFEWVFDKEEEEEE